MAKIAYLRNPSQGVHYHRLEIPMSLLSSEHNITETDIYKMHTDDYEVVIFNRLPYQPLSNLEKLKKRGVKIIMDIDDYWTRPAWHGNYYNNFEEDEWTSEIIKALRLADVIWVSTPFLQRRIAELQLTSYLVPNALHYEEQQFRKIHVARPTTVGWVGGGSHHMDFRALILPMRTNTVQPVLCGVNQLTDYWYLMARIMGGGDPKKVKLIENTTQYNYAMLYNELDIVVLPSYSDTFTMCKSNLKLLEAGAFKLPVITNGGVYSEVNKKIGINVSSPREWVKAINKLKESKRMRQDLGESLHEYTTKKYDIHKINQIRNQTI
jgi:glycosyltransferase involved in cell wall biosynthesis